jgi:hypothetical protein
MQNIKISYEIDYTAINGLLDRLSKITQEEKELLRALNNTEKQTQKTTNEQAKAYNNLANVVKSVGAVIIANFAFDKIKSFTSEVLKTTSSFQKYEAVLTNTLGSQKKSAEAMQMIQKFAAQTPFSVDELTNSFVKLANRGFVPAEKEMRSLGDLASSLGKPFDQLTEAILDAMTGEMERLKEFGVKSQKEGDRIKFTFKGVKTEVANTEEAIKKYVLSLGDVKGVTGSMGAISKTLEGQISNLGDTFDQLKLAIGQKLAGAFSWAISGLNGMITAFTNFISPAKTFTKTIEEEREGLNLLVRKITDTNVKTDERKQLIQQLQSEYPNFLKNLDAEKVSNEQLADRLREANKEYRNKLLLATSESALQTQAKKLEKAREQFTKADLAIDDLNNKILLKINDLPQNQQRQLQAIIQGVENDSEKLAQQLVKINNDPLFKDLIKEFDTRVSTIGGGDRFAPTEKFTEFGELLLSLKDNLGSYQGSIKVINGETENFAKSQDKFNKKFAENNIFTDRTDVKKTITKTQELNKNQKEELEKQSKLRAELNLKDFEAQRKMEIQRIENQKSINEQLLQNDKLTETEKISLLKGGFELEKQIINLKKDQELTAKEVVQKKGKEYDTYTLENKKLSQKEIIQISQKATFEEIEFARKNFEAIKKLEEDKTAKKREEAKKQREQNLNNDLDSSENLDTSILLSELETLDTTEKAYKDYQNYKTELLKKGEQYRRDIRMRFLEVELSQVLPDEVEKRKEIENEITQIKKENQKARLEDAETTAQKEIELEKKKKEAVSEIIDQSEQLGLQIADTYYQIRANNLQSEIDNTQAQKDYELKMAGDNAEKKAFIEREYNSKLKSLKREQAQQEKEKAIFDAVINTTLGVAKAIAKAELFPFNFVLAGIIGAMGVAQVLAIQSKPLPKFFEGTDFLQRGNNPLGRDTIPLLANEGERIVPTEINKKLGNIKNSELPMLVQFALANRPIGMRLKNDISPQMQNQNLNVIVKNEIDTTKIPQNKFIFDKQGFSEYVINTNKETKNLNADYSL